MNSILNKDSVALKVIIWRIFSIVVCTLTARIWFGDWHATVYGIFISIFLTILHYFFELFWDYIKEFEDEYNQKDWFK